MPRLALTALAALSATVLFTGCGTKHSGSYEVAQAADAAAGGSAAEADALWENRSDTESLKAALAKYEEAIAADPTNRHVAGQLVRGYYFLADAHTPDLEPKLETFNTAINWGKSCLAINENIKAAIDNGKSEEEAIDLATAEDVPCIYWTSSAYGKWSVAKGFATTLKYLGTVKAFMGKVEALNPEYFNYGPDRYWGAVAAKAPSFAGGDPAVAKVRFDASIAGAPDYIGTYVLIADYLATKTQDVDAYLANLEKALSIDTDAIENLGPEQRAERAKALKLLDDVSERFIDATEDHLAKAAALRDAANQAATEEAAPAEEAATEEAAPAEEAATEEAAPAEEAASEEAATE